MTWREVLREAGRRRRGTRLYRAALALRQRRRAGRARRIRLVDYRPRPMLRVPEHLPERAAVPAVDAHNHLGRWLSRSGTWMVDDVAAFVDGMDALGVRGFVNLDGRWGSELEANLDRYDRAFPGRFATFCHLDWGLLARADGVDRLAASLRASAAAGARGLKVWKDLGLSVRDASGALVLPDDERLDPVWGLAGELGLPVLIHVGDPAAFFEPLDRANERLEELLAHPEWHVGGPGHPPLGRLLDALVSIVTRHRDTRWIVAHAGYPEDLAWVARLLDGRPNVAIDIAGRLAELGRQPRAARALLTSFPDRVLFGSDCFPPEAGQYRLYFRFLETADEHFPYAASGVPSQGRWHISGLDLPRDVLARVYAGNATRMIPGLDPP